ncbi:hypothetical protein ACIPT2_08375 [Pectobacterium brasiliense]|uniref:hypothetical protein n=1 Tax=Pectobacterium brasiliense TaxID=180957 RepID=UPI0038042225
MTTLELISIIINLILLLVILCSKTFVQSWVKSSVNETFSIRSEDRAKDYQKRMKAELMAELMAEWLSPSEDRKKLRELTFKAFLWLPKDIAEELSGVLSHKSGDFRKLIGMVREHLLEEEIASEKLDYINVIGFGLTPKENSIKKSNEAS